MARKPNMWSASAAVGDNELRGIPEGWAPERDGTIELPRATASPSPSVYSVGKLGGAHRRSERTGGHTAGRGQTGRGGQSILGRAGAAWTSVQPTGGDQPPAGSPYIDPPTGPPYTNPPTGGSPYIDPPAGGVPYIEPTFNGYPVSGYPGSGHQTGSYPTSGHQTGSYPISGYPPVSAAPSGREARGSRRPGGHTPARQPSGRRPMRYTGARRRFSGWAPVAGGVLMLTLVLGATTLAESGRYSDDTGSGSSAPAAANAAPTTGASAAPKQTADNAPALAVAAAINKELDTLGCGRVAVDQSLVTAAQKHIDAMVASNTTATPNTDGSLTRAKTAGYNGTQVAEAVVTGAGSPAQAAQLAFPEPGTSANPPAAVQVVSAQPLSCGWTSVGAEGALNGSQVMYWSIVLGK